MSSMFRCALLGASRLARSGAVLDRVARSPAVGAAAVPALAGAPAQAVFSKGFAAAAEPALAPSIATGTVTQVPARSARSPAKPRIPLSAETLPDLDAGTGTPIATARTTVMLARLGVA